MSGRRIIPFFLASLFFFIGCSQEPEAPKQDSETKATELTLPQIPKLSGPYKPSNKDIQTALWNAGFYEGEIDGDIGPLSQEAIRAFQAENDLVVDGKVGPKTWGVLEKYLHQSGDGL